MCASRAIAFLQTAVLGFGGAALPIAFVPNVGQAHSSVRYFVQTPELRALFTQTGATFQIGGDQIAVHFAGANPDALVQGRSQQSGRANFLLGSKSYPDVPLFGEIVYRDLYPNIDLIYGSQDNHAKSEFHVGPGGDPGKIVLDYSGAVLSIAADGALLVRTERIQLREDAPLIFQIAADGSQIAVNGRYRILSPERAGFELDAYNPSLPLVIDPTVSYSTYLAGSGMGAVTGVAVDSSGNQYVTGWTESLNFPIAGAVYGSNRGGVDAFVAKLNPAGTALLYSTYIGGAGDDRGAGIAVDSSGQAWVVGSTASWNFPVASPLKSALGGAKDAFVLKLNSVGNTLLFSTFWGGTNWDVATGVALDSSGNAYVCGDTASANLSVLNAAQSSFGGVMDGFAMKISAAGALSFSTFLGGLLDEHAGGIAVDTAGASYITGGTMSVNFPTLNPAQAANGGGQDAFVTKLTSAGAMSYSTYLGGSSGAPGSNEQANAVAVNSSGQAFVAGVASSVNFPVTSGALQTTYQGGQDAFVTKLTATGTVSYSTFLGGSGFEWATGLALDSSGNAHISGFTSSFGFPSVGSVQNGFNGMYDGFVTRLTSTGSAVTFSTYYGGTGSDVTNAITLDSNANIYIGGQTGSTNFPLTTAIQTTNIGGSVGWVARFAVGAAPPVGPSVVSVSPSSGSGNSVAFTAVYSHPSGAANITSVGFLVNSSASVVFGCYVTYSPSTSLFTLWNDAGTTGTTTPAGGSSVQNGQCILNGTASTVNISGNTATLTMSIIFRPGFTGARTVHLSANDANGGTGLVAKGTWTATVPAPQPSVDSVSPNNNTGGGDTFTFVFSDTQDPNNITGMAVLFNSSLTLTNACYVVYDRTTGTISLVWEGANGADSRVLGASTILQNSKCAIGAASTSINGLSAGLTLNITFKAGFSGTKNIYLFGSEGQLNTGWVQKGTYTVIAGGNPRADSVVPGSGSASSQRFSFSVSDLGGSQFIKGIAMLIAPTFNTTNACSMVFDRTANVLSLAFDNPANGAASLTPGANVTVANSQCSLRGANSTVVVGTTSLVVTVDILFNATFSGPKSVFLFASETGFNSGWNTVGLFTVTGGAPTADSVTPSSGSGSSATFFSTVSDSTAEANITGLSLLFTTGSPANVANTCYLVFNRTNTTIGLYNDAGTSLSTKGVGSAANLQNSQCAVGYTVMTISGNSVTFRTDVIFKAPFAGAKSVYLLAQELFTNSGFVLRGTWTVP